MLYLEPTKLSFGAVESANSVNAIIDSIPLEEIASVTTHPLLYQSAKGSRTF